MDDPNWLAVNELVLSGLRDADVLTHPPQTEQELGYVAETITDHVVSAVELSREQEQAANQRWAERARWFKRRPRGYLRSAP